MARAPSYDFERRERQKAKDAKRAEKMQAKREKKADAANASDGTQAQHVVDETEIAAAADKPKQD